MSPSGSRSQVAAWVATRLGLAWAALSAWFGAGTGTIRPWSDVELYADYAARVAQGALPYAEVAIEYPAGSLPLLLAPEVATAVPGLDYLTGFVLCAVLLDLAAFVLLRRLGRRWGSTAGVWAWVVGVVLLGPVALLRLDLLPVVAVLWAVERAAAGQWSWTGGLLTLGAAAKLWPAGLLPAALASTPRWRRVAVGTAVAGGALLAASAAVLGPMLESSVLRNLERGLQVETLWASLLLSLQAAGVVTVEVTTAFGADQVSGPGSDVLAWCARIVPVLVVALGAWLARRPTGRPAAQQYAHAAEAATLVLVAGAGVLSVQFLLWALGAVTVVACIAPSGAVSRRLTAVVGACLLTAVEFPWLYEALKDARPLAVAVVLVRNLLLVTAAALAVRGAMGQPSGPSSTAAA